jgi:osmotically-inducible protein OsmY
MAGDGGTTRASGFAKRSAAFAVMTFCCTSSRTGSAWSALPADIRPQDGIWRFRDGEEDEMSTGALSDLDVRVREHVVHQLDWDPEVDASGIGVSAKGGVVTLTGYIDTYGGKLAAERAAKRVPGVRGVANDLEVRLKIGRTDADIARDAVRALELRETVPASVQAVVHEGHVTLTGKVGWLYQARDAEKAVRHIKGVRGVFNHIEVAGGAVARDVRHRIVEALHRNADLDARHVKIEVSGAVATLSGSVTTWQQRETAEHAAASAPGITRVKNEILVEPLETIDEIC